MFNNINLKYVHNVIKTFKSNDDVLISFWKDCGSDSLA
jgi:hypothetical protein